MWLKSPEFDTGAVIPKRYTCDGENLSPPLVWGDVPSGTRSLAIICIDPDAPSGVFYHWAAYNIPLSRHGLGEAASMTRTLAQGVNDFRKIGYGGPCPPRGDRPHRYQFQLLALSKDRIEVPTRPTSRAIERVARESLLEEATFVGIYGR